MTGRDVGAYEDYGQEGQHEKRDCHHRLCLRKTQILAILTTYILQISDLTGEIQP